MRLFVRCQDCGNRIYLAEVVDSRSELPYYFELNCTSCRTRSGYYPDDVTAEAGFPSSVGGAAAGGLIGLLGGPLGLILGAIAGGALGAGVDGEEDKRVRRFNES